MESRKALTPRAREMYELIKQYFESGLQQRSFCEQIGINLTTFQKWLYYYRKDNANRRQKEKITDANFIPIEIQPTTKSSGNPFRGKGGSTSTYTIEYPNGVILRMNGFVAISEIHELLKFES